MNWFSNWLATRDWVATGVLLTLVVSIAALGIALREHIERRREVRAVRWSFEPAGEARYEDEDEILGHMVRLSNIGTTTAAVLMTALVGGERSTLNNPLPGRAFPPARTAEIRIEPCDISKVWLLIMYLDSADGRWVHFIWLNLADGALMDERLRQVASLPKLRSLRRLEASKVTPVGPSGAFYRRQRFPVSDSNLEELLSLATAGKGTSLHS